MVSSLFTPCLTPPSLGTALQPAGSTCLGLVEGTAWSREACHYLSGSNEGSEERGSAGDASGKNQRGKKETNAQTMQRQVDGCNYHPKKDLI